MQFNVMPWTTNITENVEILTGQHKKAISDNLFIYLLTNAHKN